MFSEVAVNEPSWLGAPGILWLLILPDNEASPSQTPGNPNVHTYVHTWGGGLLTATCTFNVFLMAGPWIDE